MLLPRTSGTHPGASRWRRLAGMGLSSAWLLSACGTSSTLASPPPAVRSSPAIEFAFRATDGSLVDSYHTRGRATALLFITTYDWASQVAARRLSAVILRHRPRANAAGIVLEGEEYRTLADVFRSSLRLPYPVALADETTRAGTGPFGPIPRVPTLIVLDRDGRESWRQAGLVQVADLESALARAAAKGSISPEASSPGYQP
jgi:hypothetical protein